MYCRFEHFSLLWQTHFFHSAIAEWNMSSIMRGLWGCPHITTGHISACAPVWLDRRHQYLLCWRDGPKFGRDTVTMWPWDYRPIKDKSLITLVTNQISEKKQQHNFHIPGLITSVRLSIQWRCPKSGSLPCTPNNPLCNVTFVTPWHCQRVRLESSVYFLWSIYSADSLRKPLLASHKTDLLTTANFCVVNMHVPCSLLLWNILVVQ